jgi:hypothetical protein
MFYGQPAQRADGSLIRGLPPTRESVPWKRESDIADEGPLDILNTLCSKCPTGLPSDIACLTLLRSTFPSLVDDRRRGGTAISKRALGTIGVMREILVCHRNLDYGGLVKRCLARTVNKI